MTLESDTKFEDKLTNDLENNMRNFANIHQQHLKVGTQNWDFGSQCYDNEERRKIGRRD